MRRRNVGGSPEPSKDHSSALESLKKFDVYSKVHDDYLQTSQAGGWVTLITAGILVGLFWVELMEFVSVEVADSVEVDVRINQKLPISMNVTFPHLRCEEVSVDTVDSAGDSQVDVHGAISKISLDKSGTDIAQKAKLNGACSPCTVISEGKHRCCNTCEELVDAYTAKGLATKDLFNTTEQCRISAGCRIEGKVIVSRVSGNVHVALGKSTIRHGKHMHEFSLSDIKSGFNTSHTVHSVTFGETMPGMFSPLDGMARTVRDGAYMFHYYVKLVPTVFTDRYGKETFTNQYSATSSARNVQVRTGELSGLPGVFIVYDFSPFLVSKREKVKPWSYIFTSICAIIGGVFSVASLVEMALARLWSMLKLRS